MHRQSWRRTSWLCASLAAALLLHAVPAGAQIAGENVNMVTGIGWPGGDPFLQRQNEPTLAVSSANPQHLMAGANDYRAVDIKVPAADLAKINGDAWLGVFKSLDGGQTWKSVLLPGYPQDPGCTSPAPPAPAGHRHHGRCGHTETFPSVGGQFALCGLPAAADPVMRSGTDGMLYLAGINFQRDKLRSRVFLARYIDLNNKENGDATRDTDPIRYLDTRIIAENPPNVFIDKPWMTVDIPRAGAATCEIQISDDPTAPRRRFPGGTIYVGWSEFTLPDDLPTTTSTIKFTWSQDCGKTWVVPYALNTRNSVLNQGLSLAVEPLTGRVYAAWRRIATPTNKQTDAIMVTRSEGRKKHFANPRAIARITPFDQGTSYTAFRTEALPTMAISSDGTSSWAHLAWQQRKASGVYESRIVLSSAKVHPPPAGDQDDDEPEEQEDETRLAWTTPVPVDDNGSTDDAGNTFTSGHQVMPALTFSQGRLMLVYYDTRFDHTRRYYRPRIPFAPTNGSFYEETLAPVGELAPPSAPAGVPPFSMGVFNAWINDGSLFRVRHTLDVRVAGAAPGLRPTFTSILASKFPFGIRGDEWNYARDGLAVTGFGGREVTVVSKPTGGEATGTLVALQQLQVNPPNYPMFKNGSKAFLGDYIDIQGPSFVPTSGGGWAFNIAATPAPVFHAVWTSNQDVQVPKVSDAAGFPDWSQYAPPFCPTCNAPQASRYFNDGRPADACVPGAEASRDQNLYTSRIGEGLIVTTPQNMKPLDWTTVRSFVVAAQNTTGRDMTVRFGARVPQQGPTYAVPDLDYSFTADLATANRTLTVVVPARSYVSRSVFARLPASAPDANPLTTIDVSVSETGGCTACRSGYVTLNPPTALGSLVQPDGAADAIALGDTARARVVEAGLTDPSWVNGSSAPSWVNPSWVNFPANPSWVNLGYSDPSWVNPSWVNPAITNANWASPSATVPSWVNDPSLPSWVNPSWVNPSWVNTSTSASDPSWVNPSWVNPSWVNPSWVNPSWVNPSWVNPSWVNPSWVNSSLSDLSYSITNDGNTSTSYHVKVVGSSDASTPTIELNLTKGYTTPGAAGCRLIEVPRFLPVVSVPRARIVDPGAPVDPGVADGDATNATVTLAPGESALITLRANVPMLQMAQLGSRIGVASVPSSFVPDGTTYLDLARTPGGGTVGVGTATATTLTYDPLTGEASVTVTGGATPTGAISFIRGGTMLAARYPLGASGSTTVSLVPALAVGEALAAYYPGDATHGASVSSSFTRQRSNTTTTLATEPATWTANGTLTLQAQVASLGPSMDMTAAAMGGATVTFRVDGVTTTVPMTPATGTRVSLTVPALGAGPHTISAHFDGFRDWLPSDSAPMTQTVQAVSPLGISGAVNDGFIVIRVNRDFAPYDGATVAVNLVEVPRVGPGTYQTTVFELPAPGQPISLTITTSDGQAVSGTALVPDMPTLTAPTAGSFHPAAEPIAVTWSYPASAAAPDRFALEGQCGPQFAQCVPGVWQDLPGSARSTSLPARFLQPLTSVHLPIYAYNTLQITGDVLGASRVIVNNVSPTVTFDTALARMPTPRASPAVAVLDGLVYAAGGYEYVGGTQVYASSAALEAYDRTTDTWTQLPPMPTARQGAAAVALGGRIYVLGGLGAGGFLDTVEIYDPLTGSWATGTPMPTGRYYFGAAVLNGLIYTVGGWNGAPSAAVYEYTPSSPTSGTWAAAPFLPVASAQLAVAVVDGSLYAYGGWDGSPVNRVFAFNTAFRSWSERASLPTPRWLFAGSEAGGLLYAAGGSSTSGSLSSVEVYDPETNSWAPGAFLPYSRHEASGATIGGVPYLIGGFGPGGLSGFVDPVTR